MNNKPKLAVVSTWHVKCGIAAFAHKMVPAFEEHYEVDVFPLEQGVLRSAEKKMIKHGNYLIKEMTKKLKHYDVVNIQLEPGIFGERVKDIFYRLELIIKASKKVIITFHTVRQGASFRFSTFIRLLFSKKPLKALDYKNDLGLDQKYVELYQKINRGTYSHVTCLYHTKSAEKYVKLRYPNIRTINFPLTFINLEDKDTFAAKQEVDKKWIQEKYGIDKDKTIVASYGFISEYKGYDTVIKAIYECSDDYRLVIFGAVHPNAIKKFASTDKYLGTLIGMVDRRNKGIPDFVQDILDSEGTIQFDLKGMTDLYKPKEVNLIKNKVIFAGSLNDDDFERAVNGSDINVLAYQEVGQTSSGPIAISLDLKKPTIASNTKTFGQLARYAPNCFDQFDIGNHLQLKKLIELYASGMQNNSGQEDYEQTYNIENRVDLIHTTLNE